MCIFTMELSPESTKVLYKNTTEYLHNIQNQIPNTMAVLKSYYALKFRILQRETNIYMQEPRTRCPRCCLKLPETNASYVIKPEPKKSKFMRKILCKIKNRRRLTKFQSNYMKKVNPQQGNMLVVTCNFCKKELVHNLCKPVKCPVDVNANKQTANNNKKRRKKKKDPFCGLQKAAVISTQLLKDDDKKIGNKTVENKILQRKVKKIQKKNIRKLKDTLNQLPSITTGNSLNNFLRSYEQIK